MHPSLLPKLPNSHEHKGYQCGPHDESGNCQGGIDWDRVPIKSAMCQCIQTVLGEVGNSGKANDSTVDATECSESKDLGRVIPAKVSAGTGRCRGYTYDIAE